MIPKNIFTEAIHLILYKGFTTLVMMRTPQIQSKKAATAKDEGREMGREQKFTNISGGCNDSHKLNKKDIESSQARVFQKKKKHLKLEGKTKSTTFSPSHPLQNFLFVFTKISLFFDFYNNLLLF